MPAHDRLDAVFRTLLARRDSKSQLRRLTHVPAGSADFSSNAYLSLSTHPDLQRRYLARVQAHVDAANHSPDGSAPALLGSGGSRLLDGNMPLAESLERDIAAFHGAPAGLLFNSGFDANVGLFGCVPQPGDVVVYDELIHASVHDGMRMSRAGKRVAFAHNVVGRVDETDRTTPSLSEVLAALTRGDEGRPVRTGLRNVFVAVEGIYSMDGDVAPLGEIVECVERHLPRGNGLVVVDEAHSTGLLGERGRGLVCELGLEDRVWGRVHTFGKAMSCAGAIVLCSPTTRSYLVNYARSLIYTTAMPFTALAGIQTTYDFVTSGRSEPLARHLWSLVGHAHQSLLDVCRARRPAPSLMRLAAERPRSPIIPLLTCEPRGLARHCQRRGFMLRPIVAPTVPAGSERVRICLHAGNTVQEVDGLVSAIGEWLVAQMGQAGRGGDVEGDGSGRAALVRSRI
ncbi:putative 8-amino-7-oxononanoate synthase [Colletotrichum orbiculare MAFF 240422]|uniref:8-amino-7-oxononanoate synthase n=1 Tax=Colletotrichum orbiculare (strain 104-T / ATCC 96160 / CBS 514.97 / LARS 414 / MAFF 240422) TaxID=1213857 RepID=N4UPW0_COLOR|nr:putative 8-amino-7-oxononanoate synthase [Colletotrichum orbiculare MAFF 240422]